MTDRRIETYRLDWQGMTIGVRYEPRWHLSPTLAVAHLQVEAIVPVRAALPITETGYKSQFLPPVAVEALGGPVVYVRAWLDHEAKRPAWIAMQAAHRQLSLF